MIHLAGRNIKWLARWLTTKTPYESKEKYGIGNSSDLAVTLIILKEEISSCKEDNDRII